MTWRKLATRIALAEGKKHEAAIADVREVLKIIRDMLKEEPLAMLKLLLS
jgi:hypothetical protein